jgi:hypothetical protein
MSRPPKEDRDAVRTSVLTLKLSVRDRAMLGRLAEARAAELRELTGQTIDVTMSGLIRWLAEKEASARGIATTAADTPADTTPRSDQIHGRLEAALAKGTPSIAIARAAGLDPAGLSRFRKHRKGLSAGKLAALDATLVKLGRKAHAA